MARRLTVLLRHRRVIWVFLERITEDCEWMNEQQAAKYMLEELEAGRLEVAKVESQQGGYVRVCVSVNCEWYKAFCRAYEGFGRNQRYKKPRTYIKRCHTIAALKRIMEGDIDSVYAARLEPFISEHIESMKAA